MSEELLNRMANAIRQLRQRLFDLQVRRHAQEGVWEDEADERRRKARNEEMLADWHAITERIIKGEELDACGDE